MGHPWQVLGRAATAAAGAVKSAQPLVNIVYGRTFRFDRLSWSRLASLEFTSPDIVNAMLVLDDITVDILGNFGTITNSAPFRRATSAANNAVQVVMNIAQGLPTQVLPGLEVSLLPGSPLDSVLAPAMAQGQEVVMVLERPTVEGSVSAPAPGPLATEPAPAAAAASKKSPTIVVSLPKSSLG